MADTVEDIKSRLGIVDIVSQYVQLKKTGNSYKGLCPFHNEKTPSFVVSPEKQICHCFGCGKGGDIFSFIQEIEGINFIEALQVLADRAGIKIEKKSGKNVASKSEKDEFFKAHELACEIYEHELFHSNDGKKVLSYLYKRGLNEETIKEFKIGFAPDSFDKVYPQLIKKGISKNVLIKSGLVSSKNLASDNIYDKFRKRLMFPIFDHLGRICGFGGRALSKEQMPKYLNSPENVIYNKSKVLYGFSHAKKHIKSEDRIILVEGYFDVILPYQEGIKNVVATSGTALTEAQVKFIKRFTKNTITCFDGDKAGIKATIRAYSLLKAQDFEIKSLSIINGKDPADAVTTDKEGFIKMLKEAPSFLEYIIEDMLRNNNKNSFEGRNRIVKEFLPYLKELNSVESDHYIRLLASKLNLNEDILYDEIKKFKLPIDHPAREHQTPHMSNYKMSLEETMFSLILEFPLLAEIFFEKVTEEDISSEFKRLYKLLSNQYNCNRTKFEAWDFSIADYKEEKERINRLLLFAESRYGNFPKDTLSEEVTMLISRFKDERKTKSLKDLEMQIAQAEKNGEESKLLELLSLQQELLSKN
ncbi:DNA primase [Candidatus Peregrinibacteria bacterium]|nr:DNA primase [Candidatus Peregrinibacteria bacterium]